jgi:hypothetical protein
MHFYREHKKQADELFLAHFLYFSFGGNYGYWFVHLCPYRVFILQETMGKTGRNVNGR